MENLTPNAFVEFPKISRLNRDCIITEKIDGTNAQIYIGVLEEDHPTIPPCLAINKELGWYMYAGSRTRWIHPMEDNHGFAKWAMANAADLFKLGPGRHFGEWWGPGIQRGYGLKDKKFSLFNTSRWTDPAFGRPDCCDVVPVLYHGPFSTEAVSTQIERLRTLGSVVSPGFMRPEGVVVFHTHSRTLFKVTLEKDQEGKGK